MGGKASVIQELFNKKFINDALELQNKRNMVIALQGDNQAIAQSQLETAVMTNIALTNLSNSVNQIGEIIATYIDINEAQKYEKHEEDLNQQYNSIHSVETNYDFSGEDALFEYEYGVPN